jgi:radical SAM superfamily enzyme YgiQ (UPF0313 family)
MFRRLVPGAVVVFGGHHAGAQDLVVMENHGKHGRSQHTVDFVVRGEGEIPLTRLLQEYPEVADIPGITYLDHQGEVRRNPLPPLLTQEDLDAIPITFGGEGIRSTPGKFDHVTYVSARGCPLSCAFCAVANQKIRAKSIPAIISDLAFLVEERGYRKFAIEDNFFAHSPSRTRELCDAIAKYRERSGIEFTWDCQTRVESIREPEILSAMERAGCEAVYIGVESLVEEHLTYLAKTPNPSQYIRTLMDKVVPSLLRSKVNCYINLQLGLPGEQESHRRTTIDRLEHLGLLADHVGKKITVFPMLHVIYPGTRHFEIASRVQLGPDCFESFTKWEAREEPIKTWLGEHFAHGTGGIPIGILKSELLKIGKYEVEPDAVFRIANYLTMMRKPGIYVFAYGPYLVQPVGAIQDIQEEEFTYETLDNTRGRIGRNDPDRLGMLPEKTIANN